MKLTHEQILECYSGVKSGEWTNQEVRKDLIKKFESYLIECHYRKDKPWILWKRSTKKLKPCWNKSAYEKLRRKPTQPSV